MIIIVRRHYLELLKYFCPVAGVLKWIAEGCVGRGGGRGEGWRGRESIILRFPAKNKIPFKLLSLGDTCREEVVGVKYDTQIKSN